MANITRLDSNARLSRVVIHGDTVYVAGITSSVKGDIVAQTAYIFEQAGKMLAALGLGLLLPLPGAQAATKEAEKNQPQTGWFSLALAHALQDRGNTASSPAVRRLLLALINGCSCCRPGCSRRRRRRSPCPWCW